MVQRKQILICRYRKSLFGGKVTTNKSGFALNINNNMENTTKLTSTKIHQKQHERHRPSPKQIQPVTCLRYNAVDQVII